MFNENVLLEKYKDMVRVCVGDGYVLPSLIRSYDVPWEYRFGSKELKSLYSSMGEDVWFRLCDGMRSRRSRELGIVKGLDDVFVSVDDFHRWEVLEFVRVYPRFRGILLL